MRSGAIASACAVALVLACGGKNADEKAPDPSPAEPATPSFDGLGGLSAFSSLLSQQSNKPGPYDEPIESDKLDADAPHLAVIELSGPILEIETFSWFGSVGGLELRVVTDKLRELAADENVSGLVLRVSGVSMSMATADELRAALIAFKGTDGAQRDLVCHAETLGGVAYYVATACNRIAIAPAGGVEISGAAATPIHLRGMLDKIGVVPDFVNIGDYKGGPEPLTKNKPSAETIETLQALMDTAYATQIAAIAESRKLSAAKVRSLVDRALFTDVEAVDAKLVDEIADFYGFVGAMDREWQLVRFKQMEEPSFGKIMEFLGMTPPSRPFGPHIAVVYAVGNVVDGRGEGILGARGEIASRTLSAALRALARDDAVRAVVLRIDSPGGSALASEQILRAVQEVRANKPVIVSMGSVAASGGYYIAARANKIYAEPNTITGSIGVFGGKLVVGDALAKLGIDIYPMGKGKRALMWSIVEPWSTDEREAVRAVMQQTYKTFVTHVAEGRGKSYAQIHAIAQGRVWTGADALERGLVDEIGGLDAALAQARRLAEVGDEVDLEIYPPDPTLLDLVGSFGQVSAPFGLDTTVAAVVRELGPHEAAAVEGVLRQLAQLRDNPVQAALLLPIVVR